MSPMEIVLLVLGIVVPLGVILALAFLIIGRKIEQMRGVLRRELEASGQTPVRGPDRAGYQGASAGYTIVKGAGVAALTATQLVFRPVIGRPIDVPLDQITGVRDDKWFLGSYKSGRMHTILKLRSGAEVGFMFQDHEGWMAAFRAIAAKQGAA
jgi:hypothetical protein